MVLFSRLVRRATAVCTIPAQSTQLAINISLAHGVSPLALPIAALEELIQRPGVLATPRDLMAWVRIDVLRGSTLRAALEGFASSNTPIPHYVACRLLSNFASIHVSNFAVEYLAHHLRKALPATLTASDCKRAIRGLALCHCSNTDPLYATLVARIKEKGAGCDPAS